MSHWRQKIQMLVLTLIANFCYVHTAYNYTHFSYDHGGLDRTLWGTGSIPILYMHSFKIILLCMLHYRLKFFFTDQR